MAFGDRYQHIRRQFERARSQQGIDAAGRMADAEWERFTRGERIAIMHLWEAANDRLSATRRKRAARSTAGGQVLIEFAFIAPIMFALLLVSVDLAMALDAHSLLGYGVREGAAYGATGADPDDVIAYTVDQSGGILTVGEVTVCYTDTNGNDVLADPGDTVAVSATHEYALTIGSGELMAAFGAGAPTVTMTPTAQAIVTVALASGAVRC